MLRKSVQGHLKPLYTAFANARCITQKEIVVEKQLAVDTPALHKFRETVSMVEVQTKNN